MFGVLRRPRVVLYGAPNFTCIREVITCALNTLPRHLGPSGAPINPLPFVVIIWVPLKLMVVGRERAYGVVNGCVYGVGNILTWGRVGATNIPTPNHEVQNVERILLTMYTLIAAIPPNDTNCPACDYATPRATLDGWFIKMFIRTELFNQSNLICFGWYSLSYYQGRGE